MKVSHEESLANYFSLQQRCGGGNVAVLSVCTEGNAGHYPVISNPIPHWS